MSTYIFRSLRRFVGVALFLVIAVLGVTLSYTCPRGTVLAEGIAAVASDAYSHDLGSRQTNTLLAILGNWITTLALFVAALGVLVVFVTATVSFNLWGLLTRARQDLLSVEERLSKKSAEMDARFEEMKSQYKPEKEIREAVRADFERGLSGIDGIVRAQRTELASDINRVSDKSDKLMEELRRDVYELRTRVESSTKDAILREVGDRYKQPADLEGIILGKVGRALAGIEALSGDDRRRIADILVPDQPTKASTDTREQS